jgi:hypothetical protein
MIPTKGFGLRNIKTKQLVGVSTRSNAGGDCCCETQYLLDLSGDTPWIVEDALTTAWVRENSTEWYNAGYDTPTNEYDPATLEVVEIELVVKKVNQPKLPTLEEYYKRRYTNPDIRTYDMKHYTWVMSKACEYQRSRQMYTMYDLYDLLRMEEGRK